MLCDAAPPLAANDVAYGALVNAKAMGHTRLTFAAGDCCPNHAHSVGIQFGTNSIAPNGTAKTKVLPKSACSNRMNRNNLHAVYRRYRVDRFASFVSGMNVTYVGIAKNRVPVVRTIAAMSKRVDRVLHVLFHRAVFQIGEPVVGWLPVLVIHHAAARRRPNKSGHDGPVNRDPLSHTVYANADAHISIVVCKLFEFLSKPSVTIAGRMASTGKRPAHASVRIDFVQAASVWNRTPLNGHGSSVARTINER